MPHEECPGGVVYNHKRWLAGCAGCRFSFRPVCLAVAQKKPVTLEAVAASPARTVAPAEIVWAPDGRRFAYEQDKSVWLYDVPAKTRRALVSLATLSAAATPVPAGPGLRVAESRRERADHPVVSGWRQPAHQRRKRPFSISNCGRRLDPTHRDSRGGARSQALAGWPPCFLPPRERPLLAGDCLAQTGSPYQ